MQDCSKATGLLDLARLTAAMNGQEDALPRDLAASPHQPQPYSSSFVQTLLGYYVGGVPESETATALHVDGPSVLLSYVEVLEIAAERIGMSLEDLVVLHESLNSGRK